jgi:phosphomannomutase
MKVAKDADSIRFGTDGWRGIIADDFTFANVCKVTRAIAYYLKTAYTQDRPVLIAYDTRFLADEFAQTAAEVLADEGWTVKIAARDCPTPAIAYSARALNSAGALMFTASHNPAIYCGIKYIPDYAGPATPKITDAIVAQIPGASAEPPRDRNKRQILIFDPQPDYLNFLCTLLDVDQIRKARLRVQYDALYSTSRGYLDVVLNHCGCQTETFHMQRDVLFGGGIPDPKGKQLDGLVEAVKRRQADLGVATDGDSDRFGIVDEQGRILTPNAILLLLTRHLIKKGKTGAIARTVATTHSLDTLALKYGLELHETPVGFKYIGQKMRETDVLIGGEESGGLSITGHIPEKDGVLAAMLVAEAIAYAGKPLSKLVEEAIAEAGGPRYEQRLDFCLSISHKAALMTTFSQNPPAEIMGIKVKQVGRKDGIKLHLEDGSWVLLRPSGTEPLMRVYLETDDLEKQPKIAAYLEQLIHSVDPVDPVDQI